MSDMPAALSAFFAATIVGSLATVLVRSWAISIEFVDHPDKTRKNHERPVALGGGFAIFASTLLVFLAVSLLFSMSVQSVALLGLLLASLVILVTGFIDDRYGINGKVKLLLQVLAACLVVGTSNLSGGVSFLGIVIHVGAVTHIFTLFWILAAINSLNLIDGIDGLAANVGLVFATSFGVIALLAGFTMPAVLAFCLAGSLLGFLRYNSAPASIYLGDTGSMLAGLILGWIAVQCLLKEAATLAFSAPLTIWAIPFFDSLSAILRRKLTGQSIYATDRGHIHHVLLTKGLSTRGTVAVITGLCFFISIATVAGVYLRTPWIGPVAAVLVIGVLVSSRLFGHVELVLLNRRLAGIGRYITQLGGKTDQVEHTSINLQGEKDWDCLWAEMVESAERYGLIALRLNLFLPREHENFFASWKKNTTTDDEFTWSMQLPFVSNDYVVGRLKVSGDVQASSCLEDMHGFVEHLQTVETEIHRRMTGTPVRTLEPEPELDELNANV